MTTTRAEPRFGRALVLAGAVVFVAGCGRLGFDATSDAGGLDGGADADVGADVGVDADADADVDAGADAGGVACPPGELDPTFGDAGRALIALSSDSDQPKGLYIDAEGRAVVGIQFHDGANAQRVALARLTADGVPDGSFGTGGVKLLSDTRASPRRLRLVDGGILASPGQTVGRPGGNRGVIALTDTEGVPLPSFGVAGFVELDLPVAGEPNLWDVAADGGAFIAVGDLDFTDMVVVRLTANGSLDPSFGTGGVAVPALGVRAIAKAVAVIGDRILVAGLVGQSAAIVALRADGSLEPGFGIGGVAAVPGRGTFTDLYVDAAGAIVATGTVGDLVLSTDSLVLVARFSADGTLDATFGGGGFMTTTVGELPASAWPGVPAARGGTLVSTTRLLADGQMALGVVLVDENGVIDPSFATAGEFVDGLAAENASLRGVSFDNRGRVIAAGWSNATGSSLDSYLFRFCP